MNPTDSTYPENHKPDLRSRSSPSNGDQRQLTQILDYRIRLLTALILGIIAGVSWQWQPESKYVGKFYLLLAPFPQNASATSTETAEDEMEIATQAELLRSPQVLEPLLEKISIKYPDLNYANLIQQPDVAKNPLTIKRLEQTKIVEIAYENQDPQKIDLVLNQLAIGYVNYGTISQQTKFNQRSGMIKKEVSQIHQRISQSQQQLDTFRQQHSLYNPEQQAKVISEQLANLEMESYQTQIQLQEAMTLYKTLEQQLKVTPEQALASSDLSESSYYQDLVKQLQEVEILLAQETTIYQDSSPNIQTLKEKQNNLKSLIKNEEIKVGTTEQNQIKHNSSPNSLRLSLSKQYIQAANTTQVLQSRKAVIDQQIKALRNQIEKIPILARQYAELQQKINWENNSINNSLATQNQLNNETVQSLPWQLLSQPQLSQSPISPNPQKNLVLGLLSGLSLGLMLSVLAEMAVVSSLFKKS